MGMADVKRRPRFYEYTLRRVGAQTTKSAPVESEQVICPSRLGKNGGHFRERRVRFVL